MTDYFPVIDKLSLLMKDNEKLVKILNSLQEPSTHSTEQNNYTPILQSLLTNAQNNCGKVAKQRRHTEVIKKFASLLFIYCGSMAYEFLQNNVPEALPSLRSVQHTFHSTYTTIKEGDFRFDALVDHLKSYKAPFIVSISEDATRVIKKVEYDISTNRCVGFVLPNGQDGLPKGDSFIGDSFADIEIYFKTADISNYAYLYAVQPLQQGIPSFCLSVIGTNNKFTAEDILTRWKFIHGELLQRGIKVLNFSADGDTRLMKAMRITMHLTDDGVLQSLNKNTNIVNPPFVFDKWLCANLFPLTCFQDMVHIGVKLKSRLLKPSIILPMGSFLAGSSHLTMVTQLKGKDEHGLRGRDLDHHDKQNFTAVENIIKASDCLDSIPEALGTKYYINIMSSAINSFLQKKMTPLQRIEEIWYATFFLRYWRQWILNHPKFTLKDNFITSNSYVCVEINAHSLLAVILTLRHSEQQQCFLPWILGSQSCEQTFRSLRSMTGTFSTIINFSMLGILHRLHKLAIKHDLESQSNLGILCPRLKPHHSKEGHGTNPKNQQVLNTITNEMIKEALERAELRAKRAIINLGMAEKLDDLKDPPIANNLLHNNTDDSDDDNDESLDNDLPVNDAYITSIKTAQDVVKDVNVLLQNNVVDSSVKKKALREKQLVPFESEMKIPVYACQDNDIDDLSEEKNLKSFVAITVEGKEVYIRKTTAVWLLQDSERVSSDRIFRVRSKQSNEPASKGSTINEESSNLPIRSSYLVIGDVCAFNIGSTIMLGRVLQFAKKDKKGKITGYKGNYAPVNETHFEILCTWYKIESENRSCQRIYTKESTEYISISNYLCTVTYECLEDINYKKDSPFQYRQTIISLKDRFCITRACMEFLLNEQDTQETAKLSFTNTSKASKCWVKIGKLALNDKEKTIITTGKWLTDFHMCAAQLLLKSQFSYINGLRSTCYQDKEPLSTLNNMIQIITIGRNHWSVISTCPLPSYKSTDFTINYYDSLYHELPQDAERVIISLTSSFGFNKIPVTVMPIAKQSGCTDCGLYAIAIATAICYNVDPVTVVFAQDELRPHLLQCFEKKTLQPFPIKKNRKSPEVKIAGTTIFICPKCRKGDYFDGESVMIECEKCLNWYHEECIKDYFNIKNDMNKSWFCTDCIN